MGSNNQSMVRHFFITGMAMMLAGSALAAEIGDASEEASVTNRPVLAVNVRSNVEGTYMPYRYAFLSCGLERFTFLVPDAYKVDTADPACVKLFSPDYKVLISVGLPADSIIGKVEMAALKKRVMENYPEAVIKLEHALATSDASSPALDFTWKASGEITRRTRTTLIPTTAGVMEFTMTSSPEKFTAGARELDWVLMTFRSGRDGKFDYVVGSKTP